MTKRFTVALIRDGVKAKLYSKYRITPTLRTEWPNDLGVDRLDAYYHGVFNLTDETVMEELLLSVSIRCEELGIVFSRPYAEQLLMDHTF